MVYLKRTTKADVLDLISTFIHTSSSLRAKFSTHLRSTATPATDTFDPTSTQSLITAFTAKGIPVDPAQLQQLLASNPSLETVKSFALDVIGKSAVSDTDKSELRTAVDELKSRNAQVNGDSDVKLRDINVIVDDLPAFKAGLIPSRAPTPLEPLVAESARL